MRMDQCLLLSNFFLDGFPYWILCYIFKLQTFQLHLVIGNNLIEEKCPTFLDQEERVGEINFNQSFELSNNQSDINSTLSCHVNAVIFKVISSNDKLRDIIDVNGSALVNFMGPASESELSNMFDDFTS